ncbi:MAG: S41 family peptidase [Candidatus Sulfotelmatobacter sp.]|jgi:carboxyl-terminal processing protease
MNSRCAWTRAAIFIFSCIFSASAGWSQKITGIERDQTQSMLRAIASDVKKHYYDPTLHGLDWDRSVREAQTRIDQAGDIGQALSEIAALLDLLKDSHTFLLPPARYNRYDYGWEALTIGAHCYVTQVRPGSDAAAKGVTHGDEILTVNGFAPTKKNLIRMEYLLHVLRPQPALRLELRAPDGKARTVDVATKIIQGNQAKDASGGEDVWGKEQTIESMKVWRHKRTEDMGDQLMILKLPVFFYTPAEIESIIGKARRHSALIIDLRGNGGGSVEVLSLLLGRMFDHDVKIADRVGRSVRSPQIAKSASPHFDGKLIVLVDSRSASAAELFARVVQIEKRGTVVGDVSSGQVMEAKHYIDREGVYSVLFYGASITDADLIMTDGRSLEGVGVTPDQTILPTATDLAVGHDPVLARAAEMVGVTLNPEAAGKLFPYEWPPQ